MGTVTAMPSSNSARPETLQEIDARITKTFNALTTMANGVVAGHVRSLIISGAAGCGKTYTMEHVLSTAKTAGKIEYGTIRGSMSPIGLYKELYTYCTEGQVLVIDDCDSVFSDLDSLNLLKAALDTSLVRKVYWNKESSILAEEGIDRNFEFDGACVFCTNIDFQAEIDRETKMSTHYSALLSRSIYVDLGIHSKLETFVRISQVALTEQFLKDNDISKEQSSKIVKWIYKNLKKMRSISIRTVLQMAAIIKTEKNWEELAEVVMLRTKGRNDD